MDILISILSKELLETRLQEFVEILADEPHEYWNSDNFRLQLPKKFDLSIVAINDHRIAGYIIASLKDKGPYIHKFIVRKEMRGISVGEKLFSFFVKNISEKGYSSIDLTVREDNLKAIKFYRRNMFEESGTRLDTVDNSVLLILTKQIRN